MSNEEILYNKIPPSKLRNGADPFIKSTENDFSRCLFDMLTTYLIKKNFYSLKIKNRESFNKRNPDTASIIFAQHHCWWDGMMGYFLCRKVFNTNFLIMAEELVKCPWLANIGAFSVDKKSPKAALKSLNYGATLLQNHNNSLWLFPQGIVNPPDYRPIKFANGISYLCDKLKNINIIPVAIKYVFLRSDMPEILIEIADPIIVKEGIEDRKDFTEFLEQDYTVFLNNQLKEISSGQLHGYETFFKKKKNLYQRYENFLKNKK
jgi:1-acyl-sn-glycerol-3-phosphate acyltransferase